MSDEKELATRYFTLYRGEIGKEKLNYAAGGVFTSSVSYLMHLMTYNACNISVNCLEVMAFRANK